MVKAHWFLTVVSMALAAIAIVLFAIFVGYVVGSSDPCRVPQPTYKTRLIEVTA